MPNKILITGATGNIGSKLTSLLLAKHSDDRVVLLVRGRSDADARDRIRQLVKASPDAARLGKAFDRLEVLAGDITQTRLGLGESAYEALARSLTHVVHSAASTCFTLPLASARLVNVQGTVGGTSSGNDVSTMIETSCATRENLTTRSARRPSTGLL